MKLERLRGIRISISLFFFLFISTLFLDLYNYIPNYFTGYILYFQFIPSLFKFINLITISAAGFIFISILTLLFGRIYCSSLCPLGTLQDIISGISKRFNKKKYYRKIKDYKWFKYSILTFTIVSFFAGSLVLITLLDPFSNFGRIFTNLFKPVLILFNNLLAISFNKINLFLLYPIEIKNLSIISVTICGLIFLLIFILSYKNGRLFCNTVCPVGILLGLVSKLSLYKIHIDKEKCNSCNLCTKVCKSGCIDKKDKEIDFARCVSCFNCFNVCPTGGISYENSFASKTKSDNLKYDPKRRELISKTILFLFSFSGFSLSQIKIIPKEENKIPVIKKFYSSPPGSKNIEHYTSTCTGCHLCISSCPTQVLQPSLYEYGILGILQPYMDYKTGFCNFECKECIDVCPSGAILPLALEDKKLTQIGKAKFIKENCIVEIEKTECGACSEHCPTKAVKMIPYKNLHLPEVKEEYCIGCGACEFACPTKPYKAIYVEGNPVHLTAKKLPVEKLEDKVNYKEDFPF